MDSKSYWAQVAAKKATQRTPYFDNESHPESLAFHAQSGHHLQPIKTSDPNIITYELKRGSNAVSPNIALLILNDQTRKEALPIFYGENIFSIRSIGALLPFLKDRTIESLPFIKSIKLRMRIVGGDPQRARDKGWVMALNGVGSKKFTGFAPKELFLFFSFDERHSRHHMFTFEFTIWKGKWLKYIYWRFSKLEWFGFQLDAYTVLSTEEQAGLKTSLWKYLAPRILNTHGEPHNAASLGPRRIDENDENWLGSDSVITEADDPGE